MPTATTLPKHRYATQILATALSTATLTYLAVVLHLRPGIWNILWMFGPALLIALSCNRSGAALVMTCILLPTSWIVVSIVGGAMGGI
ncbi:hypothetical protein [Sphingomonas sp. VNH70]|uniref:hypothetical protein n=1 Tax=Sphingomonas silueang TaxID=3156617 RepID=UPI0032B4E38A